MKISTTHIRADLGLQATSRAASKSLPPVVDDLYAAAQGKTGAALLRELHQLTTRDHQPLGYRTARRDLFRTVANPTGNGVVDLYTGQKLLGVKGLRTATEAGLTTEHVWPQSEGAKDAARSDLHHLRPALGDLNSQRSNLPFGEVVEAEWKSPPVEGVAERSKIGLDDTGTRVFAARPSMRGDLARDQLYFFTRYDSDRPADYSVANFRHSIDTLLRWHRDDPVDDSERRRNDLIAQLQGNRNPFVDRPDLVEAVDFPARIRQS